MLEEKGVEKYGQLPVKSGLCRSLRLICPCNSGSSVGQCQPCPHGHDSLGRRGPPPRVLVSTLTHPSSSLFGEGSDKKQEEFKTATWPDRWGPNLEKLLAGNAWFVSDDITHADVAIFEVLRKYHELTL